jgi:peptide/nickel transport system permease protein
VFLSALLPGGPQLLAGRWLPGIGALLLWGGLLLTLVLRWDRVVAAPSGRLDERVALGGLILSLGLVWWWSFRDVRYPPDPLAPRGQWAIAWRAFLRNRLAVMGLGVVVLLSLAAVLTPFLAPFNPAAQGDLLTLRYQPPGGEHLLGTDRLARDVLSRLLYGARISLSIGFVAVGIAVTIGTLLGAAAGYLGGWVDTIIMRFTDMVISFPRLVLLITIIAVLEPSLFLIVAVLGLTQWTGTTRLVRGEVLSLKEREFIQAARALGYSRARIILRHLIPNTMAPVIVAATLGIGNTIVLEAGLSFLGLGVQPPTATWGSMVNDGKDNLLNGWWVSTFSGLAIVLTVVSFNLVGDGLRDALDPRVRGR